MPAESERLRRRLGARDRWFLGAFATALVAGTVATAVILSGHNTDPARDAGCVVFSHPNFTGGATYRYCGPKATVFCRHPWRVDETIIEQCAQLGIRVEAGSSS